MSSISITQLHIDKTNLQHVETVNVSCNTAHLKPDQVLLQVDSFGFSANNITYALMGDKMGYWGFFPAAPGKGILPVWGFATVIFSQHADVQVGERVFGYLPMASHLVITAGKTGKTHFYDVNEQRKGINPLYDQYIRCAHDPAYNPRKEAWQLTFRPLFATSFLLDDYVGELVTADTRNVILTSASSKTAYGAAFLLKHHQIQRNSSYSVSGLTSPGNLAFCKHTRCYDRVYSYQDYESICQDENTVVLDFAGNKRLLLSLQSQLNKHLQAMIYIGVTDVAAQMQSFAGELQGEFFFAPTQHNKRSKEWGSEGFMQRYGRAWSTFSTHVQTLLNTHEVISASQIQALYLAGLKGQFDTDLMYVARFP